LRKEHRGIIPGESMAISNIPCSKGERLFNDNKIGGAAPRRFQARGESPRGEWPFSIDVKGGEMVTLV
jgi:hypothetical protein